jgi:hypothetical protein
VILAGNRAASIFFARGKPAGAQSLRPGHRRRDGTFSSIKVRIKTPAPGFGKRDCEIFHELGEGNPGHKEN